MTTLKTRQGQGCIPVGLDLKRRRETHASQRVATLNIFFFLQSQHDVTQNSSSALANRLCDKRQGTKHQGTLVFSKKRSLPTCDVGGHILKAGQHMCVHFSHETRVCCPPPTQQLHLCPPLLPCPGQCHLTPRPDEARIRREIPNLQAPSITTPTLNGTDLGVDVGANI